ncbi:DUF4230 domain-containing protein [Cytobacillus firmus]|uniref:DUF4230 domain-containing protein n=1 Tax=Cytobacillus firmus DS1 TaxID=1307436 RepID=W7L8G3_CYTFI|nr:DUF4230 domain-containing protein [Cytobacillus firmus]EWG11552.1 hypothetical protein PBF_08368 [Cytobacillus firmus DS1]
MKKRAAQSDIVLRELRRAKEESAAGTAPALNMQKPALPLNLLKIWKGRLLILAIMGLILAGYLFVSQYNSNAKKESILFVDQVRDLAMLASAEAHVKVVIEHEDNKLFGKEISLNVPGTKRELLMIVPATVIAGVKLDSMSRENIKVNEEEKKLEIILPRADLLQEPAIQLDQVVAISDEGLLRGEPQWDDGFAYAAEAQEKIKEEAIQMNLLERAEKNAEKILKEYFSTLGYSTKIVFK